MIIDKDKHPTEADYIIHTVTDGENLLDVMHIPLIRCKDCKYWKKCIDEDYCSYWEEYCWIPAMEDDFCSRGERINGTRKTD